MPKISVIMPCFNHARFLEDSIRGVICQTHKDIELIIIDDSSLDDSWGIIKHFAIQDLRIKTVRHGRNQGLSKCRNKGLQIASGEFIAFCDSDDIWEADKLQFQLALLHENQSYGLTYCDTMIINEDGVPTGQRFSDIFPVPKLPSGWMFSKLVRRNFINIQSVLITNECIHSLPYFDEQIDLVQDWWCWIQLSRNYRFLYSPELLARYRIHSRSTNLTRKYDYCVDRYKVFKRILRKYTDLPHYIKADLIFQMGAELCDIGKIGVGRQLLWNAVGLSMTDLRAFSSFCRALRRLIMF